jgi:hypothetical protein
MALTRLDQPQFVLNLMLLEIERNKNSRNLVIFALQRESFAKTGETELYGQAIAAS